MRLSSDDQAASPLVVILTFVAGAILVTATAYALLFDRPEDRLELVQQQSDGSVTFEVVREGGGLSWDDVTLRFVDRAGTDQAATFLQAPGGDVDEGDLITLERRPPAGTYVLTASHGGNELARLVVEL